MSERFRAFSFVDRIHAHEQGKSIRGSYAIPTGLSEFSHSLVAEAVGQLAAWAAMAAVEFKYRAVAGLASRIDLLAPVKPGQVLDLSADLETVDTDAIAYGGSAHADGMPIIQLVHCVGPMLPLEDFDDPILLRERLNLLQGSGAKPGQFKGLPRFQLSMRPDPGGLQVCRATLIVPASAPLFEDHFPRRPVFPGSLLMNSNFELAAAFAAALPVRTPGTKWQVVGASDVKLRVFTLPGDVLDMEASLLEQASDTAIIAVRTHRSGQLIGSVRVRLEAGKRQ